MNRTLLTIIAGLALGLSASADIVAQWTFNDGDASANTGTYLPATATGSGSIAGPVGAITTSDFRAASGSSDPLGTGADNSRWRMLGFPDTAVDNKTAGAQFTVDTTGYKDITMSWDQININVGSRYWRIQYSLDNGGSWVDKDVVTNTVGSIWANPIATVSFAGVPGANTNASFMVRLVSEFESTATGSGTAGYVAVVSTSTYTPATANCGLDMVTFRGAVASDTLLILTNPASQVVAVGQPASFNVTAAGGSTPITYQWRKNTALLTDATNAVYSIAAVQTTNAGSYDVIVANGVTNLTSAVATLTVRVPANLAWTGLHGATWDTNGLNWQDTSSLATVAYSGGDHVLFDSRGAAAPTVSLADPLNPSSVTVNANTDYTFRSDVGGKLTGTAGLTKQGSGTLIVDTDNTYTGPTVIEAGVVQLGLADAHGSLGSGPITNNGALVFNRTDALTLSNTITGSGSLTNSCTLTLAGVNTYGGPLVVKAASLILGRNQTINSPDIIVTASTATGPSGATKFAVNGGQVVGAGTTIHFTGLTASPDCRATFQSLSGTNYINAPMIAEGNGAAAIQTEGASTLTVVNGNVSGPGFAGTLFLRGGNGTGILNGNINLPGCTVHKADSSTWTITSTGNSWNFTSFAAGILRLGAHNALPTGLILQISTANNTATLDVAGFNQQLGNLSDTGGTAIVTNSSATANSTLTLGSGSLIGTIADSAAGGKISLTINGNTYLRRLNTYHGDTTVSGGTLYLTDTGDIPNSPVINLAGGALDAWSRFDVTLPVYAGQTLKGNGTLTVSGNLVNNGTIELKVNKTGGIVSNDKLAVSGQLVCGGTLKLDLSGAPLNCLDVLTVFEAAAGYAGSLPAIDPPVPAPGATWDTSTLLIDGTLRILGPPVFTSSVLSGTSLSLSGGGGNAVAFATFSVVTSTNVAAPPAAWTTVQTGSFDGSGNFSVTVPFTLVPPQQFYMLKTP